MLPLVLAPGLLCDRAFWEPVLPALESLAGPIHVMSWGALDSFDAMADLLLAEAPAPTFALAGHSMGGRIAMEVCRKAPHRVSHLALMNTNFPPKAPGAAGEEEARGRYRLLDIARTQGMRPMGREWLKGMIPSYRQTDQPLVDAILDMFERKSPDLFAAQIKALLERPDAGPVLPTITAKTLVLTGVDDAWSGPAAHQSMHAAIPGSSLVLVPECGHMSAMERPAALAQALHNWLSL